MSIVPLKLEYSETLPPPPNNSAEIDLRCSVFTGAFVFGWGVGVSQHLKPLPVFEDLPGVSLGEVQSLASTTTKAKKGQIYRFLPPTFRKWVYNPNMTK